MGTREPSVESIFVAAIFDAGALDLGEIGTTIKNPLWLVGGAGVNLSKHRNSDAPGDLPGNVPIFEVFQIIDEDLALVFGVKFDLAGLQSLDGGGRQRADIDKPLLFEHRLQHCAAFVAMGDRVGNSVFAAE